ncbi:MAG: ABC transporter ATP-binding protein [Lentisphaeraceae bacterium]|nr:ABC transporter ATP-binding protein [Lentisphaeraceae bacterium]
MPEVKLQNLCKTFSGDVKAVDNLNLTVNNGELLVLVGPSGCGKSTSLRMIAGLEEQSSGTVSVDTTDISQVPPGKRNIGMVFQNYALYPNKTIFKNLSFGMKIRKVPKAEINSEIQKIAKRLEIDSFLNRYPSQLSGGQKQRVALARALLRGGDIVLFDEPLSNLDASLRQQLRVEIAELHRERKFTGIFVTHDQIEAMTIGDRIAVMNYGKICQIGTPEEIYNKPADSFVASFIGTPAMNIIDGKSDGNTFHSDLFELNTSDKVKSIGFRPEHVKTGSGDVTFTAIVVQPELCGMDWVIHCRKGNIRFSCRTKESLSPGTSQEFSLSTDKLHYFDSSGRRLDI